MYILLIFHNFVYNLKIRHFLLVCFANFDFKMDVIRKAPVVYTRKSEKVNNKGLVINYGEGGLQNGKIAGLKLFAPPPPQDRVKLFAPPLFKEWEL